MIIEKSATEGDIVTFKLIGGEEVIGRLDDDGADTVKLSKPMTFMMGPQGLGLVPWMFSAASDAKISIRESVIVARTLTDKNVAKQYIQQTTSLIV